MYLQSEPKHSSNSSLSNMSSTSSSNCIISSAAASGGDEEDGASDELEDLLDFAVVMAEVELPVGIREEVEAEREGEGEKKLVEGGGVSTG